jgi:hypothetical protein
VSQTLSHHGPDPRMPTTDRPTCRSVAAELRP